MPVALHNTLEYKLDAADAAPVQRRLFAVPSDASAVDFDTPEAHAEAEAAIAEGLLSISVLLDQHRDAYKLASTSVGFDEGDLSGWRRDALENLRETVAHVDDDTPITAELAFLAALSPAAVESFAQRATALLTSDAVTRRQWESFVRDESRASGTATAHFALPPLEDTPVRQADDEPSVSNAPTQLSGGDETFTFAELRTRVRRGALRGQQALVDASSV